MKNLFLVFIFSVVFSLTAQEDDEWDDDWEDDWQQQTDYQLSHKVSYGYSHLLDKNSVNIKNFVLNEIRSKSLFEYQSDEYSLAFEAELTGDKLTGQLSGEIYQFNILIPFESGTDIKVGRQVITWGTGDLLFLNDLFSKDWQSLINGRDNSYLKPPVDALRVSHYGEKLNVEVALLPQFKADRIFKGERYSFYLPGVGLNQPQPSLYYNEPDRPELAARLFNNENGKEWAIYFYNGYFKSPSKFIDTNSLNYAKMSSIGASLRMPLSDGVFNTEFSLYSSRENSAGLEPFIQNSQFRFLLGYEKEVSQKLTLGLQAYLEKTLNYPLKYASQNTDEEFQQVIAKKNRTLFTLRLTQQAMQQRLLNQLMLFYSPSDKDYYWRYQSHYTLNDRWKLSTGINWFGGAEQQTFFAQLQDNSNIFLRAQYSFQ